MTTKALAKPRGHANEYTTFCGQRMTKRELRTGIFACAAFGSFILAASAVVGMVVYL